jgi:heterokaryon incompatibility protein (HET)
MDPYAYQELKETEIRLATLHPGRKQDDIRLSIEHATLIALGPRRQPTLPRIEERLPGGSEAEEEKPKRLYFQHHDDQGERQPRPANPVSYEALSYTWGSLAATEVAYIVPEKENGSDDASDSSTLPLGQNLAQALRGLRYEDRERTLWVDAICINQENPREVDVQVARAGTVYEEARRVVVWLGQESHDSGLAIRTLDFLATQVMMDTKHSLFPAPDAIQTDWHLPETPLPYDIPTWTAIDSLLRRPWFTRVWVQQELHLADEAIFHCGAEEISREKLRRATFTLYTKQKLGPVVSRAVVTDTMRTMLPFLPTCTIFHTFSRIWNGQCKNKKDLVYGALGLFPPSFRRKIKVDYSLPIDKVYMDFVKEHIKHVNRLEILRHCQSAANRPGLPSWVPDFSSRSAPKVTLGAWHFSSGHSACHFEFRGPVLEVVGVQVAVIKSVGEVIPMRFGGRDGNFNAAARVIRRLVAEFQAEHAGTEIGSKPENFIWNLLGGTWLHDRLPENLIGNLEQVRSVMRASKVFGSGKLEDGLVELSFPEEFCMNLLMGARVTKTTEGHIGIAPANAQKGTYFGTIVVLAQFLTDHRRHHRLLPRA